MKNMDCTDLTDHHSSSILFEIFASSSASFILIRSRKAECGSPQSFCGYYEIFFPGGCYY